MNNRHKKVEERKKDTIYEGCSEYGMVGERSIRGEVRAEALVDCMEVRMPE